MTRILFFVAILVTLVVALPGVARAREDAQDGARTMHVVITLDALRKLDVGQGTFSAEFYLSFRCDDAPCRPDFALTNGHVVRGDKIVDEPLRQDFRVAAEMDARIDLSDFPFDSHVLPIGLFDRDVNVRYDIDGERSAIGKRVQLAGWAIAPRFVVEADSSASTAASDERALHDARVGVAVRRPRLAAFFKTLAPVVLMAIFAGFALLLRPNVGTVKARLATAAAGLLGIALFHVAATSSLPPTAYLTLLDKLIIATYVVALVNIGLSVAMVRFEEKQKQASSHLSHLIAAGIVPGFALVAWVTVLLRLV